jgi:nitric oxide reductase NorD protein
MPPLPETRLRPRGPGELPAYLRALWRLVPRLAVLAPLPAAEAEGAPAQRPVLHAGAPAGDGHPATAPSIHLPAAWNEDPAGARRRRAAVAHAAAHLVHGHAPQDRGRLKPIQQVLLGVLEDARVEWLAMQELPGLRGLWLPWHTAGADSGSTFEALLQRLSRSLADPAYRDPHPWVHKARRMFYADEAGTAVALHTAQELRHAASLLGNDVGQMRLPFNARLYAVEPCYRDDNSHLWCFHEELPPSAVPLDGEQAAPERGASAGGSGETAKTPSARHDRDPPDHAPEVRVSPRSAPDGDQETPAAGESRQVRDPGQAEAAVHCSRYPEWDRLIARYREGWCSVFEARAAPGARRAGQALLAAHACDIARAHALLLAAARRSAAARPQRSTEGESFHLNRLVDARISQRLRLAPDPRIYLRAQWQAQALDVLLLADVSASTADAAPAGGSQLDAVRRAALVAAAALERAGHRSAIWAFSSNTREHVRIHLVKGFDEAAQDEAVAARLAGLRSEWSTRLGAVLRHAAAHLARKARGRPLVLLLSDGAAHDVDVHDARYLAEDFRRARADAARTGIATALLDPAAVRDMPRALADCIEAAG